MNKGNKESDMHKKIVWLVFASILFVVVLSTEIVGVDFGYHWDERQFIESISKSIKTRILLPGRYNYPSLCYDLYLAGVVPDLIWTCRGIEKNKDDCLINIVNSKSFQLRMRVIFILISYVTVLWIYLLVLKWRKDGQEALLAAATFGLSWEIAYHARWAVSDTILVQFSTLTMMCLFFVKNSRTDNLRIRWLILSAIAAALTCGTKYQGFLFLGPVLLAVACFTPQTVPGYKKPLRECLVIISIFIIVYLMTTPGTIIAPLQFSRDISLQRIVYRVTGHGGYTVDAGIEHFLLLFNYFCLVVFSNYRTIACFFFLMSLLGAYAVIKEEKKTALVFLSFPLLYIIVMSCQKVMIVRNYLVLVPFFSILASRGFTFLQGQFFKRNRLRTLFLILVILFLLVNTYWLISATQSITDRDGSNGRYIKELASYLDKYPIKTFLVSKRIMRDLQPFKKTDYLDLIGHLSSDTKAAVFYSSEVKSWQKWTANRFNYTWRVFGPYEVNFNYYPSWAGDDRIIVMPIESAIKLELVPRQEINSHK